MSDIINLHTEDTRPSAEQLAELVAAEPETKPATGGQKEKKNQAPKVPPPQHTDLSWVLTGERPPVELPNLLTRTDGHSLLYSGRVNLLYGDPEAGKTWIAKAAVVEALAAGDCAAMIDVDHNGSESIADDLMLMGVNPAALADEKRFRLYEPDDAPEMRLTIAQLCEWKPQVVVIDSLGELLPMLGRSSNDNDDVTVALRITVTALAKAGICVVAIDHLPKGRDGGSAFAIGAMAKKRACDGTMLLVRADTRHMLAPGRIGKIHMSVTKDRRGQVRKHADGGKRAGTFVLDSTGKTIDFTIRPAKPTVPAPDGGHRPTFLMGRISGFLAAQTKPVSQNTVEASVTGNSLDLRRALTVLVAEGFASHIERKGFLHVKDFTDADDEGRPLDF